MPQIKCQRLPGAAQPSEPSPADNEHESDYLPLELVVKRGRLVVGTPSCPELAHMNSKATFVLLEALKYGIKLQLWVKRNDLHPAHPEESTEKQAELLYVDANVLGPEDASEDVGRLLSRHGVYLQDPHCPDNAREYTNPHLMVLDVEQIDIWFQELAMDSTGGTSKAKDSTDWNVVLDDLPQQHTFNANAVEVDTAIVTTPALPYVFNSSFV